MYHVRLVLAARWYADAHRPHTGLITRSLTNGTLKRRICSTVGKFESPSVGSEQIA